MHILLRQAAVIQEIEHIVAQSTQQGNNTVLQISESPSTLVINACKLIFNWAKLELLTRRNHNSNIPFLPAKSLPNLLRLGCASNNS